MTDTEIKYMQEALTRDLIVEVCETMDKSLDEAMNIVYSSDTFRMLCEPKFGLYYQSPVYLMDCLEHELKYGKVYG